MNIRSNFSRSLAIPSFLSITAAVLLFVTGPAASKENLDPSSQSAASASTRPNLSGTWTLNKDLSDDPRQKMQQAMGNSGGGQGGPGGGGTGGGGGQSQGGRGHGGPGPGGQGPGMMQDLSQLTVTQTGPSVKIAGASGRVLAQTSDLASSGSQTVGGDDAQRFPTPVAQWQGSQLTSVMEGRRGGKTTRTYELSPDGKQLIVTTKIENERLNGPVTIKQVYDPVKAGSASSQ